METTNQYGPTKIVFFLHYTQDIFEKYITKKIYTKIFGHHGSVVTENK